jgi:magnesium transporter
MLAAYRLAENGPQPLSAPDGGGVPDGASWVDVLQPTPEEDRATESFLGTSLPTRAEMQEIEFSSRFYTENGAVYMTVSLLVGVESGAPVLTPFTIVVAGDRVATLRYEDFRAFRQFLARAGKPDSGCSDSMNVFLGLIEAIIDRMADVIERIGTDVDHINREVFAKRVDRRHGAKRLEVMIDDIGYQADLAAKARESLASLERLIQFASLALPERLAKGTNRARLRLAGRDIRSIEDQASFLNSKISFLLDATLGLISVQQNDVIRILTVVTTVFFPPSIIGAIYGMNFKWIPELSWDFGYFYALILMVISAVLPLLYFKSRGWL